jgi:hypothetical protein
VRVDGCGTGRDTHPFTGTLHRIDDIPRPPRRGVFPGSFNPPTTAHLAIAEAARHTHRLDRVVLSVSTSALAKEDVDHPRFEHRIEVLEASVRPVEWLSVRVTEARLLADIAAGFEVLIVGADKWWQIQDPVWYGDDPAARDEAMARLPTVAVVPREGLHTPPERSLDVAAERTAGVSSTRARSGEIDLMLPAAREFADRTGAWIDPGRYDRWLEEGPHRSGTL